MSWRLPDRETYLEAGLAAAVALLLGGVVAYLLGRAAGELRHASRRIKAPPAPGSVRPERHQNVGAVSTR